MDGHKTPFYSYRNQGSRGNSREIIKNLITSDNKQSTKGDLPGLEDLRVYVANSKKFSPLHA